MSKLDPEALTHFLEMIGEILAEAGFTGVKLEPSTPTAEAVASLSDDLEDGHAFSDPEFSKEVGYHRVATDQGTFGIWFHPYVTLDLGGLGIDVKVFSPPDASHEGMPEGWCLVALDEGILPKLFVELAKKSREP